MQPGCVVFISVCELLTKLDAQRGGSIGQWVKDTTIKAACEGPVVIVIDDIHLAGLAANASAGGQSRDTDVVCGRALHLLIDIVQHAVGWKATASSHPMCVIATAPSPAAVSPLLQGVGMLSAAHGLTPATERQRQHVFAVHLRSACGALASAGHDSPDFAALCSVAAKATAGYSHRDLVRVCSIACLQRDIRVRGRGPGQPHVTVGDLRKAIVQVVPTRSRSYATVRSIPDIAGYRTPWKGVGGYQGVKDELVKLVGAVCVLYTHLCGASRDVCYFVDLLAGAPGCPNEALSSELAAVARLCPPGQLTICWFA